MLHNIDTKIKNDERRWERNKQCYVRGLNCNDMWYSVKKVEAAFTFWRMFSNVGRSLIEKINKKKKQKPLE